MAKRKRLTPAQPGYLDPGETGPALSRPGPMISAPIAQVASEASATAALEELSTALESARREGRFIETLPLGTIDPHYIVRDRIAQDEEEMEALATSLAARGQQSPIEVVAYPAPKDGFTHGLISGWRRLLALQRLEAEHGDGRFAKVKALVVTPDDMQDAYVAMVEENEIRANLSLYERARIALRAYEGGVYPTLKAALNGLFGSVSRSKRSKINSFVPLVQQLDDVLSFPAAISEKRGLELSKAVQENPGFVDKLRNRLATGNRGEVQGELDVLSAAIAEYQRPPAPLEPREPASVPPSAQPETGSVRAAEARFDPAEGRIEITGEGVDEALFKALRKWLAAKA